MKEGNSTERKAEIKVGPFKNVEKWHNFNILGPFQINGRSTKRKLACDVMDNHNQGAVQVREPGTEKKR